MIWGEGTVIQFEINSFLQFATFQDLKKWGNWREGMSTVRCICVWGEGLVKEEKKKRGSFFPNQFKMRESNRNKKNEQ